MVDPDFPTRKMDALDASLPSVPGYDLERMLGAGGMGTVYLATDNQLKRKVAVKFNQSPQIAEAGPEQRQRFLREAQIMARVQHHNLASVYTFGEVENRQYIVMEYIDGESLQSLLASRGALPEAEALAYLRQAVEGLNAAWEVNIAHRDIKPDNFVVNKAGVLKVVDFGLARGMDSQAGYSVTNPGTLVGTYRYIAPERVQGDPGDYRSDIYALGLVLYRMLAGEDAYKTSEVAALLMAQISQPLPDILHVAPDISRSTIDLMEAMTGKSPDDRPTADELGQALAGAGFTSSREAESPSPRPGTAAETPLDDASTDRSGRQAEAGTGLEPTIVQPQVEVVSSKKSPARSKRLLWIVLPGIALVLLAIWGFGRIGGPAAPTSSSPFPDPAPTSTSTSPATVPDSEVPAGVDSTELPGATEPYDTELTRAVRKLASSEIDVRVNLERSGSRYLVDRNTGVPLVAVAAGENEVHTLLFLVTPRDEILLLSPMTPVEPIPSATGDFVLPGERTDVPVDSIDDRWRGTLFVFSLSQTLANLPFAPGAQPRPGVGTSYGSSLDGFDVAPAREFVKQLERLLAANPDLRWGLSEVTIR